MGFLTWSLGALAVAVTAVNAELFCLTNQQRALGAPYISSLIGDTLLEMASISQQSLCYAGFPRLHNETYAMSSQRSNGSLVLKATRHNDHGSLGEACVEAFSSIISTCITESIYWGGNITAQDVDYVIYNDAYPSNWIPQSLTAALTNIAPAEPKITSPSGAKRLSHEVLPSTGLKGTASLSSEISKPSSEKRPAHDGRASTNLKSFASSIIAHAIKPAQTTRSAMLRSNELSGITSVSQSSSVTSAADGSSHPAIVPVGAAVAGLAPAVGLPPVAIGHHGKALSGSPRQSVRSSHETHQSTSLKASKTSSSHSLTSSSRAPTGSASLYVISPKDPHNKANSAFTTELRLALGSDLLVIENKESGLLLWSVLLKPSQVAMYGKREEVSASRNLYTILPTLRTIGLLYRNR